MKRESYEDYELEKEVNTFAIIFTIVILLVCIFLAFFFTNKVYDYSNNSELRETLLAYSNNNSIEFFGTDWCPHCQQQKKIIGKEATEKFYFNCDDDLDLCKSEGIEVYPTWKINGQYYLGTHELEKLLSYLS